MDAIFMKLLCEC